jgi:hypothetical protein
MCRYFIVGCAFDVAKTAPFSVPQPYIRQPNPVPHAHFPSRYDRHRRHTLDLNKLDGLFGAFEVIHRNIEGLIHSVIEVADRLRVHDTLRDVSRK